MDVDGDSDVSIEPPGYDIDDEGHPSDVDIIVKDEKETSPDAEIERIKRLFKVLSSDISWSERFEEIFVKAHGRHAETIANSDISAEQAFELSQDHSNDLAMSVIKFRFYAEVCFIEEALQNCQPVVKKQYPKIVPLDKKLNAVKFRKEDGENRLYYNCPLFVIDTDYLEGKSWGRMVFQAVLHSFEENHLYLTFKKRCSLNCEKTYAVFLRPSSLGYDDLMPAIERIKNSESIHNKLFGSRAINGDLGWFRQERKIEIPEIFAHQQDLNRYQRRAVYSMLKMSGRNPFLLFGPPGTGKTTTLVQSIKYLLLNNPKNRILVCAHSNSAADNFALSLLKSKTLEECKIHRFVSTKQDLNARDRRLDGIIVTDNVHYVINDRSGFYRKYTVIISTIGCVSRLRADEGSFSYIFIDEAGQATEPDTWIPLARFGKADTRLVLAGDPLQLGPVLISPVLEDPRYRYDQSLLLRLYEQEEYKNDCRLMVQLRQNYRSHETIVQTASVLFYKTTLIPTNPEGHDSFVNSTIVKEAKVPFPFIFHAVEGREEGYDQFSNEAEIIVVERYVKKLLNSNSHPRVYPEDIGIVSPYKEQVRRLSQRLKYPGLTIDTVERFQGSERRVIIMTTTRTRHIGFLKDQKRLNTAITRAKHLLIIVGNPELLCQDEAWDELIKCFKQNDCFIVENGHFIGQRHEYQRRLKPALRRNR